MLRRDQANEKRRRDASVICHTDPTLAKGAKTEGEEAERCPDASGLLWFRSAKMAHPPAHREGFCHRADRDNGFATVLCRIAYQQSSSGGNP
jgi:hypothetical protein